MPSSRSAVASASSTPSTVSWSLSASSSTPASRRPLDHLVRRQRAVGVDGVGLEVERGGGHRAVGSTVLRRAWPPPPSERQLLLAPDAVARAAVALAPDREAQWMLRQPRAVRRSFVEEVFGREDEERPPAGWMLSQPREIRESFVEHVLMKQDPQPREEIWMLRQADDVRESYVRYVLLGEDS